MKAKKKYGGASRGKKICGEKSDGGEEKASFSPPMKHRSKMAEKKEAERQGGARRNHVCVHPTVRTI